MAKKKKKASGSKSQAVRDLLEKNPSVSAKDAVAQLKRQGVSVSETLVYNVRSQMTAGAGGEKTVTKKKVVKKKKAKAAITKAARPATNLDFSALKDAKQLADKLGGINAAKKALEALAELQ